MKVDNEPNKPLSPFKWLIQVKYRIPQGATYNGRDSYTFMQIAGLILEYNEYVEKFNSSSTATPKTN